LESSFSRIPSDDIWLNVVDPIDRDAGQDAQHTGHSINSYEQEDIEEGEVVKVEKTNSLDHSLSSHHSNFNRAALIYCDDGSFFKERLITSATRDLRV
jgi:hypothetical protein